MSRRFPGPTRKDQQAFCEREGWSPVRDATGRTGTHHVTYEFVLAEGSILRTRISHPPDRSTYGKALWAHVLRDQLHVSEAEFWSCVRNGTLPDRGRAPRPPDAIPAAVVHQLVAIFQLPEAEVAAMTRGEAIARLAELWTGAGDE
ncbi:MAG: cytotoxic translational repressor of toxin-antitoxin stability system [Actinobacteria bacterium 69-20]|mgnify:CR=1 FL=1|nr:cytotoxic translational repressor of toxin-antitoxin stability system [Actinomycetota bacterium]OJV29564.1 MAG: cytotoxic translational repressor of toxin-antitoxin stability system [Actinobacteria bacterium 69-20]